MEIKTMPKETLAELLFFLAENEEFPEVEKKLNEGVDVAEVRAALRELGEVLRREATQEETGQYNAQKDRSLTKDTKTIISYLSPGEEKTLLTAFGLMDKNKSILG